MKKSLAVASAFAVFLVMMFSVLSFTTVSAATDWITGGENNVTVNADGTISVAQGSTVVLNEVFNGNDADMDVSVKMAIPFANVNQFVSVILTKDPADLGLDSANTVAHRFALDGDKYALNHSWFGASACGWYCGGYIPVANGELTIRIKNDNGIVRLYMDDVCIFSGSDHAQTYSDAVKALGGAYLGIAVTSFEGPISAQILEANGKNPTGVEPKPELPPVVDETAGEYAVEDWVIGGENNVTMNKDGTVNVAQGSTAVLKRLIDLNAEGLDVSFKMAIPFANAHQFVSVILTKDPADLGLDSPNTVAHRFTLDGDKYGLNHSWFGASACGWYCGGYIPFANGELTVRIKNDNGIVRLYMDDVCIFSGSDHAQTYSDAVKALGGAYLGIAVTSFEGPISAQILEANGKKPTSKESESVGKYAVADWTVADKEKVAMNPGGAISVAFDGSVVLNEVINGNNDDMDVSVKVALPFANDQQFVSVFLTKDPTDLSLESANTVAHRFGLDGDKYALNISWFGDTAVGAYGGGYIPFANGDLTIRIKNDNGTVRLYMDDTCIFYGAEHAQMYSEAVKALGDVYLGIVVTSYQDPFTAQILEVNGKMPTDVEATDLIAGGETSRTDETKTGLGLAFKFDILAEGIDVQNINEVDLTNATVTIDETSYKLVEFGAVMSNVASVGTNADKFNLDNLSNNTIKVSAKYLMDWDDDSATYAVRLINIPEAHKNTVIYARAYYIYENENGEQAVVYDEIFSDTYAE